MKLITTLFLLFAAFISVGQLDYDLLPEDQYEHILNYHSDIIVQKNCSVIVKETITVYAQGNQIQRGIYRELPLSYEYRGGNVKVGFELLDVKHNGKPEAYHYENMSNGVRIYAGSSDVFIPVGVHSYEFTYVVDHVLWFGDDYDEIYWNVNGNGWDFYIDQISANVYYPSGAEYVQHDGYTGKYGLTGKSFRSEKIEGGVRYEGTRRLVSKEGLTVAVAWNKDQVVYPTAMENFLYWLQSYILWFIGGFGILLGFLINYRLWHKYGRDPKPGTIIPLFYPPTDFSPAECVYLKKGGQKSNTMFGSMLISLAVKGRVEIDVEGGSGIFSKRTYTIKNLNNADTKGKKPLTPIEERFYKKLMGSRSTESIQKGTYNPRIKSTNDKLIKDINDLQKGTYFIRNSHLKGLQFIIPVLTLIGGIAAFATMGGHIAVVIVAFVLHIAMNVVFARLFEQPTPEGRKKMDEIAGFEMYLKYADKERIKLMNPPTMNFQHYEENLAYAIALGVADEWAGQFDPVELEEGYHHHMPYISGMVFSDFGNLGNDLSNTISSASTPPSSSGGGSGGGGFSGGGGGGGGGGGW